MVEQKYQFGDWERAIAQQNVPERTKDRHYVNVVSTQISKEMEAQVRGARALVVVDAVAVVVTACACSAGTRT